MLSDLANFMDGKAPKVPSTKKLHSIVTEADPYLLHGFFVNNIDRSVASSKDAVKYLLILDGVLKAIPEKNENEELIKIFMRMLNEYSGKSPCRSAGVKQCLQSIASQLNKNSKNFIKFLKVLFKKVDLKTLGNMSCVLSVVDNPEIIEAIEARVKEELAKIETLNVAIDPELLALTSDGFFEENIVNFFRRFLKKSANNIPKVASFMKNIEVPLNREFVKFRKLEDLLESYLLDSFSKGEEFITNTFAIIRAILCFKKEYASKSKVEGFLVNLNKKLYKNPNEDLNFRYCELVADMNFTFESKTVVDTLNQFYESYVPISNNINKANAIVKKVLNNRFFSDPVILKWIVDGGKYNNQPLLAFLSFNHASVKEEAIEKLLQSYKEALHDHFNKNIGKKLANSSYQNIIYSLYFKAKDQQIDTKIAQEAYKIFLSRDNFFMKSNLSEVVPFVDCHYLFIALSSLDDKVIKTISKDPNERKYLGWLLTNLICSMKALDKREPFKLSKFKVKAIIEYLYLVSVVESDQNDLEKYRSVFEDALVHSDCSLSFKKQSTVNKLALLLGNRRITSKQLFSKLTLNKRFDNLKPITDSIPDFITSLFSRKNLYTTNRLVNSFYAETLASLMLVYPDIAVELAKFFNETLLCSLTRMRKVSELSKSIPQFSLFCLCDKFDLDFLANSNIILVPDSLKRTFGKMEFKTNEEFFELINTYAVNSIDEEEKFEELSNLNSQEIILEDYRVLLENISLTYKLFYRNFGHCLLEVHHTKIDEAIHSLKPSLKQAKYLRNELKITFILNFKNNLKDNSEITEQLADMYFQILGYEDSPAFVRKLEYFIRKINLAKITLSDDVFEILFVILVFAFESNIDAEYQRKLFKFLYEGLQNYPEHLSKFYDFVCKNLNELYFDEAFVAFEESFKKLLSIRDNVIDEALLELLNYEEFATKMVITKLIQLSQQLDLSKQQIQPLQKLKLLIITESENQEIGEATRNLIAQSETFKFGASTFETFNFEKMLLEFPFDIQDTIAKIFKQIFHSLDAAHQDMFLEKIIRENRDLIGNLQINPNNSNILELKLRLLAMILSQIKESIAVKHYANVFQYIYGKINRG